MSQRYVWTSPNVRDKQPNEKQHRTHHQASPVPLDQDPTKPTVLSKSPEIGHLSPTLTILSQSIQSDLSMETLLDVNNPFYFLQGHKEIVESDSDLNHPMEVIRNQSTHSLLNRSTSDEMTTDTTANITTNDRIHVQQKNIGKTRISYLIGYHKNDSVPFLLLLCSIKEPDSNRTNTLLRIHNQQPTSEQQTAITAYFPPSEQQFQRIIDLDEHATNFQIRSKVILLNNIRQFGLNKVIDGILCDTSGEIKFVAFNDEAERLIASVKVNEKIILQNGEIAVANPRYRTPFSRFEIRICPSTVYRPYHSNSFNPSIQLNKKSLHDASQMAHGALLDVEGMVILDRGLIVSTGHDAGTNRIIRKVSKSLTTPLQ
ncbi:unnamed protein product [Adineta ricciae]|uniref:Uncharacterized protein n=1 Tax=Adineta ricciae TaxID=249248 RepID=A0A815SEG2_ADIRI|nr:unnamed protein product [Adineta ricciae]